jgi:hypothetical protein
MFWLILLSVVIVIIVLFSYWQGKLPQDAVIDMVKGVVSDDPQTLADAAGVDLETYSLARVGQSEEGLSSDRAKIAVMYACKHHSEHTGKSITEIVTTGNPKRSDYADAQGHYGRQGIHPYCTTIAAPSSNTLALAAQVMEGTATDETQGAQFFDNPHTQDALALANPYHEETDPVTGKVTHKGYHTSAEIAAKRTAKRLTEVDIPGVGTRFWV